MRVWPFLSILACLLWLAGHRVFAEEKVITLDKHPLLFADDSGIASRTNVKRTIHAAIQSSAPVLEPEKVWEGDRMYVHGSVYQDADTGKFRLWYLTPQEAIPDIKKIAMPGSRAHRYDVLLYATSQDGVKWEKPSRGLHAFGGSKENNIVFDLHSPSVLLETCETEADGSPIRDSASRKATNSGKMPPSGKSRGTEVPPFPPTVQYAS